MITIVEPKEHIAKLWGKQKVRENETYRLMKYVLRVDHDGKILLHNTITGQLVVLEKIENIMLKGLPSNYSSAMEQLIFDYFIVPQNFDEHQQVISLRNILRRLESVQSPEGISCYTILPTSACNARCYYCFEHGVEAVTMTEKTACDTINFIEKTHKKGKLITINWFGGEPTIAVRRIDQICKGLKDRNILFRSEMISNGYLFDEQLAEKAKTLWNLKTIQITVDGTEDNYNKIKSYINVEGSAYQRVMRNIGLLLNNEIHVGLRMNFDLNNYHDFEQLLNETKVRFKSNPFLQVAAYPIIGSYADCHGCICHADDAWIADHVVSLNNSAREAGMRWYDTGLPFIDYKGCGAANDSFIVITATGALVRCLERFSEEQRIGDIINGITNIDLSESWKIIGDFDKCIDCAFFPNCVKLVNCSAGDRCYQQDRNEQYLSAIKKRYDLFQGGIAK